MSGATLEAVCRAAVDGTAATVGWILAIEGDRFNVAAAWGESPPPVGTEVAAGGYAALAAGSGQPQALRIGPDDPGVETEAALAGARPRCLVVVPCTSGSGTHGVLTLIDKMGAERFDYDDVELATLLADVAGAALAEAATVTVPGPAELGAALADLAGADPARYQQVAVFLDALLGRR